MYQFSRWRSQLPVGVLAIVCLLLLGPSLTTAQGAFAPGTVVALQGTPHLWIADAQGILHWAGDTRALAGRHINWNKRLELPLEQLQGISRGDPWLSAGLLKDGDPIYLVKWETHEALPRLSHIQSIRDVELFGINENNYGRMVLDRGQWEARYGIRVSELERRTLAPATALAPTPTPTPTPNPANDDMMLTEWPPVAQKHLVFTIPYGWTISPHEWPLTGTVRIDTYQHTHRVIYDVDTELEGFALWTTAVVTTLKEGPSGVLSILAVPARYYSEATAEEIRDGLARSTRRRDLSKNPNLWSLSFPTVEKGRTRTKDGMAVWRVNFSYLTQVYLNLSHGITKFVAYLEYRVMKRGNVFWIFEHSLLLERPMYPWESSWEAARGRVDAIVDNLEFRY